MAGIVPLRHLFFGSPALLSFRGWHAPMDWLESPTAHIFKINVPGFSKEQIKVQVEEGNILHISGQSPIGNNNKKEDKEDTIWHLAERSSSSGNNADLFREIQLPENVKVDQIKAWVENGVLTIIVPKDLSSIKLPKVRNINVTSKL